MPYSASRIEELTAIINSWARPDYLPLIWEAVQYQTYRPAETWIIQNNPGSAGPTPRAFLERVSKGYRTVIVDSGLNQGCWFRFLLAALYCKTRYVAIYDDDTLSGQLALETGIEELQRVAGVYGARGITFKYDPQGPSYWNHVVSGWPSETANTQLVDFVGHLWIMETYWLRDLLAQLPDLLLSSPQPARECGEDMYVSFVAQKRGIPTFALAHNPTQRKRWASIDGLNMGIHRNAMHRSGGLKHIEYYLQRFVADGWKLRKFSV